MSEDKLKYSMLIEYDDESQLYWVTLPEWMGEANTEHITYGYTHEILRMEDRQRLLLQAT